MATYSYFCKAGSSRALLDGIAGIFHQITDDYDARNYIDVREVWVSNIGPRTTNQLGDVQNLQAWTRITAMSGGDDVPVSKHDTDSDDLPTEVRCALFPDSVTGSDHLRRNSGSMFFQYFTNNAVINSRSHQIFHGKRSSEQINFRGGDLEAIVCREGEGVAIVGLSHDFPRYKEFNLIVTDIASNATYTFNTKDAHTATVSPLNNSVGTLAAGSAQVIMAIFNGSGSGVDLAVRIAEDIEGGDTVTQHWKLNKYEAVAKDGLIQSATAFDTNNSQPAFVKCVKGPFQTRILGASEGLLDSLWFSYPNIASIAGYHRMGNVRSFLGVAPLGHLQPMYGHRAMYNIFRAKRGCDGIILRMEEGLAVSGGRLTVQDVSQMSIYDVEFIFTVPDDIPPAMPRGPLNSPSIMVY